MLEIVQFNNISLGYFISTFVSSFIFFFLLISGNRSNARKWLLLYFFSITVFNLSMFIAGIINHPYSAYTFYPGRLVNVSSIFFVLFLYNFPVITSQKKEKIIVVTLFTVTTVLAVSIAIYQAGSSKTVYDFNAMEYHPSIPGLTDSILAILGLLHYIWGLILCIRKAFAFKGHYRQAFVGFAYAVLIPVFLTFITAMAYSGHLSLPLYHFIFSTGMVVSMFVYFITYVNNIRRTVSLSVKVIGITLMSVLVVAGFLGTIFRYEVEERYDERNSLYIKQTLHELSDTSEPRIDDNIEYVMQKMSPESAYRNTLLLFSRYSNIDRYIPEVLVRQQITQSGNILFKGYKYYVLENSKSYFLYYIVKHQNNYYEIGLSYSKYREYIHELYGTIILVTTIVVVLIIGAFPFILRRSLIKPLRDLVFGVTSVEQGNFELNVPVHYHDEIGFLASKFNTMTRSLSEALEEKRRLATYEKELEIARKIQFSLLPEKTPHLPGLKLAARYKPMEAVGGDLYDFAELKKNRLGVFISDVSGHGIPAALISTMVKQIFQKEHRYHGNPEELLIQLNNDLKGHTETRFVTAGYCIIDIEKKQLIFSAAGHPPVMIYRKKTRELEVVTALGTLLGFFDTIETSSIKVDLESQDRIFIYTDGCTEAMNENGDFFGEFELTRAFQENSHLSVDHFADVMMKRIVSFSTGIAENTVADDITFILAEIE